MKSLDLQKVVLRLHEQGLSGRQISNQLTGEVSKTTVNQWIKLRRQFGELSLRSPPSPKRTKRTKRLVQKVKQNLVRSKNPKSARQLAKSLNVSRSTVRRVIKEDLGYKSYVKRVAPKLTDAQKKKRYSFGIWARKNIKKSMVRKVLFSDEKRFDTDGVYNRQNDRVYAPNREEADRRGGIRRKTKFPTGVMVWLGACYDGVTRPVIIENGTIDHQRYIDEILPFVLKDGQKLMGNEFTFQQDGATCHTHRHTQEWCKAHFRSFWPKSRWPPNSPDISPLDYSIWDELCLQMNWEVVKDKKTLIDQIRAGAKKIRKEVVRRSVECWTNRVYQMLQKKGEYIF